MKEKILKLLGYNECCKCHKIFAEYGGSNVMVVSKDHLNNDKFSIENKYFCREHKPDFVFALNGLEFNGEPLENTIVFTQHTTGFTNCYPYLKILIHK